MTCCICRHSTGQAHLAREMMFGSRDEFRYFECAACGCVQLADPPADLGKYYPPTYYSYQKPLAIPPGRPTGRVRRWVYDRRNQAQALGRGGVWGAVAAVRPRPEVRPIEPSVRAIPGLKLSSRVLDIGCGGGRLLLYMAQCGFTDLTGLDPFLPDGDEYPLPGVRLLAHAIEAHTGGPYHAIMMHHSLEHLPDQQSALIAARRLLTSDGTLLVRVPTVSSAPWREYGTDWVALDPPRHFVVHSHKSLRLLAEQTGFVVCKLTCDATEFGYWGSELYRRQTPLCDPLTGQPAAPVAVFGPEAVARYAATAAADNARLDGDCLVAYLTPGPIAPTP